MGSSMKPPRTISGTTGPGCRGDVAGRDQDHAPEHEHTTGERIFCQFLLTKPLQGVDPLSSIDRLNGDQHAHLGGRPSDAAAIWEYGAADRGAVASGGIAEAVAGKSI